MRAEISFGFRDAEPTFADTDLTWRTALPDGTAQMVLSGTAEEIRTLSAELRDRGLLGPPVAASTVAA